MSQQRKDELKQRVDATRHPYTAALLASGVNVCSLELIPPAALTAAATAVASANPPKHVVALEKALRLFLAGADHSQAEFLRILIRILRPALERDAKKQVVALRLRGLPPPTPEESSLAIKQALSNTADIKNRLLEAGLTAGLSLGGFLSLDRLGVVVASLRQAARDIVEQRVFKRAVAATPPSVGFTGRRRFRADPAGRHGAANGQVRGPDDPFHLPARPDLDLPALDFYSARSDPSNVEEWSNSTARVEYEFRGGDGVEVWK